MRSHGYTLDDIFKALVIGFAVGVFVGGLIISVLVVQQ